MGATVEHLTSTSMTNLRASISICSSVELMVTNVQNNNPKLGGQADLMGIFKSRIAHMMVGKISMSLKQIILISLCSIRAESKTLELILKKSSMFSPVSPQKLAQTYTLI